MPPLAVADPGEAGGGGGGGVGDPGEAPPPPPLFLDQMEAQRAGKIFF